MIHKIQETSNKSRLQTIDTTKSTFRSNQKHVGKFHSYRKKLSFSIKSKIYEDHSAIESPITQKSLNFNQHTIKLYRSVSDIYNSKKKPEKIQKPQINCSSMCSLFADSNQIFMALNSQQKRQIASLTKIMTAFTVINICNSHGLKIRQTMITVQKQASLMEGTSANLRDGDKLLVIDLLFGLLLPSGNDAALALAQYFGKFLSFTYSTRQYQYEDKNQQKIHQFQQIKRYYDQQYAWQSIKLFVFQMNKNCHKIKLKNTRFSNPTGLSDKGNYSTAFDIAMLISFCLKNHLLKQIFKKKIYTCYAINEKLGQKRYIQWRNTNQHLFSIRDCIGVKTGITPAAGPCLSSAYKIKGRQLVIVILNSRSLQDRYSNAQKIYHYARSLILGQQKEQKQQTP